MQIFIVHCVFDHFRAAPSTSKAGPSRIKVVSTFHKKPQNNFLKLNGRELNNRSLKSILENAKYKKRKSINNRATTESDNDENKSDEKTPEFDCSGGLRLSDESDDDDNFDDVESTPARRDDQQSDSAADDNSNNENAANTAADLKQVHDNYQKFQQAKEKMKNYKNSDAIGESQKENVDIAGLLAMGEQSNGKKKSSQKRVHQDESDSDEAWEDVEGKRTKIPKYMRLLKTFEYDGWLNKFTIN